MAVRQRLGAPAAGWWVLQISGSGTRTRRLPDPMMLPNAVTAQILPLDSPARLIRSERPAARAGLTTETRLVQRIERHGRQAARRRRAPRCAAGRSRVPRVRRAAPACGRSDRRRGRAGARCRIDGERGDQHDADLGDGVGSESRTDRLVDAPSPPTHRTGVRTPVQRGRAGHHRNQHPDGVGQFVQQPGVERFGGQRQVRRDAGHAGNAASRWPAFATPAARRAPSSRLRLACDQRRRAGRSFAAMICSLSGCTATP